MSYQEEKKTNPSENNEASVLKLVKSQFVLLDDISTSLLKTGMLWKMIFCYLSSFECMGYASRYHGQINIGNKKLGMSKNKIK